MFTNSNREWQTVGGRGRRGRSGRPNVVKARPVMGRTSASEPRQIVEQIPASEHRSDSPGSVHRPNSTKPLYSNAVKTTKSKVVHGTKQVSENMLLKPVKKMFWLALRARPIGKLGEYSNLFEVA